MTLQQLLESLECRRCSECPDGPHHWIDDGYTLTGWTCKHCEAIGVQCYHCAGEGMVPENYGPGELTCPSCHGEGVVEVIQVSAIRAAILEPQGT